MEKILVVEDEVELNKMVSDFLTNAGYLVSSIYSGENFNSEVLNFKPDLIVLDLMLPHKDGYSLLRDLRADNVGVIIVSARNMENDKLLGFSLGSDDYLEKPFSLKELLARIKAILKRCKSPISCTQDFSTRLKINEAQATIAHNGSTQTLTYLQLEILKMLVSNPKNIFSRAQLASALSIAEERTIDAHIKNIRKKLCSVGLGDALITVRNIGYKYEETP
ncbi:MAG: response regulator transcription factor [Spirochaetales bacterium]|nr:response regulator transcription factor [Spirochaetales bacterium]